MDNARATLLLVVHVLFWVLGTPGLDFMKATQFQSPAERERALESVPEPVAELAFAIADWNRATRVPLVKAAAPVQRPFRVAQEWHLYRDGPGKLQRLEIYVDDRLVHRSADADADWLTPQLRSRRIRPMVESTAQSRTAQNWRGLSRWIVSRVRQDWPEATRVELRSTISEFPRPNAPTPEVSLHHAIVAAAPDWQPVLQ